MNFLITNMRRKEWHNTWRDVAQNGRQQPRKELSLYINHEVEREEINPKDLEIHARRLFLERLDKELQFESTVCEMEQIDIHPFIVQIKRIASKYDNQIKTNEIKGQYSIFDL